MHKSQSGFTLVELVVVIVLLGILGVTALGKFQDLSSDAQDAANQGVASELSAASSINYAARLLDPAAAGSVNLSGAAIDCAANLGGLFTTGYPAGYTIQNTGGGTADCTAAGLGAGGTFTCDVFSATAPAGTTALANIICTP